MARRKLPSLHFWIHICAAGDEHRVGAQVGQSFGRLFQRARLMVLKFWQSQHGFRLWPCRINLRFFLFVIPAKLAIASASRNPGIKKGLDSRFRGNDAEAIHCFIKSFH